MRKLIDGRFLMGKMSLDSSLLTKEELQKATPDPVRAGFVLVDPQSGIAIMNRKYANEVKHG